MTHRYVEEEALRRVLRQALPDADQRAAALSALDRFLARQPTLPRIVGSTTAAKMLGVRPPHVARLREQGRMPEPLEIEGGFSAYLYAEVAELAEELERERDERARRRAERRAS